MRHKYPEKTNLPMKFLRFCIEINEKMCYTKLYVYLIVYTYSLFCIF